MPKRHYGGAMSGHAPPNRATSVARQPVTLLPQLGRWACVCFCLAAWPAWPASIPVMIRVVGSDGQPVANADVALFWQVKGGAMKPTDAKAGVSDRNGKASLQVETWNEKRPVLVLSADRKFGAIVGVTNTDENKELTATLVPTVRAMGKLDCPELNAKPPWANTMVSPAGFSGRVAQDMGESAKFDFVLPAGKYTFYSYGSDVEGLRQPIQLAENEGEHDFGTTHLKASAIAKLKGKPAPNWDVTAVRGIKAKTTLADYKGKWVFLEFWGFW